MEDIKELILDKAKERFERFGYKKTTMDELCHDCGISKKTIYSHFKNKEGLFSGLLMRENQKARDIIFGQIAEITDPLKKVIQLIKISIDFYNGDSFISKVLRTDEILFSALLREKSDTLLMEEIISLIAEVLQEGEEQGKFRSVDKRVYAYAGVRLVEAFSYMRTINFSQEKEAQGYYTDVLIDLLVHSIKNEKVTVSKEYQ